MMSQQHESQDFNVIVKADVQGSLTSVIDSLRLIDTGGEITLRIVGSGVGNITENDVRLAADNHTIIYGFNVMLPPAVKQLSSRDKIEVRLYKVIYELLDDARAAMEDMLVPEVVETRVGTLTVKAIFRTLKDTVIAGGEVTSGKVTKDLIAKITRGKEIIGEADVTSVQTRATRSQRSV